MANETLIFETIFQNMNFGYVTWIIPAFTLMILAFIITRDLNEIKVILFPLTIMLQASGLNMGIIVLLATGYLFAVETFSFELLSNAISSVTRTATASVQAITPFTFNKRERQRTKTKSIMDNTFSANRLKKQNLEIELLKQRKEKPLTTNYSAPYGTPKINELIRLQNEK